MRTKQRKEKQVNVCQTENDYYDSCLTVAYRSDNFIVGLTNSHPAVHAPVLYNYTLCGQYLGAVPDGATVSVECINANERALRFRYVMSSFR